MFEGRVLEIVLCRCFHCKMFPAMTSMKILTVPESVPLQTEGWVSALGDNNIRVSEGL